MKTDTNFLRIERKNKTKFFLFLNDEFITLSDLLIFCRTIHSTDMFFIEVSFEDRPIINGFLVFENLKKFEKNIHYFSTGKILT